MSGAGQPHKRSPEFQSFAAISSEPIDGTWPRSHPRQVRALDQDRAALRHSRQSTRRRSASGLDQDEAQRLPVRKNPVCVARQDSRYVASATSETGFQFGRSSLAGGEAWRGRGLAVAPPKDSSCDATNSGLTSPACEGVQLSAQVDSPVIRKRAWKQSPRPNHKRAPRVIHESRPSR